MRAIAIQVVAMLNLLGCRVAPIDSADSKIMDSSNSEPQTVNNQLGLDVSVRDISVERIRQLIAEEVPELVAPLQELELALRGDAAISAAGMAVLFRNLPDYLETSDWQIPQLASEIVKVSEGLERVKYTRSTIIGDMEVYNGPRKVVLRNDEVVSDRNPVFHRASYRPITSEAATSWSSQAVLLPQKLYFLKVGNGRKFIFTPKPNHIRRDGGKDISRWYYYPIRDFDLRVTKLENIIDVHHRAIVEGSYNSAAANLEATVDLLYGLIPFVGAYQQYQRGSTTDATISLIGDVTFVGGIVADAAKMIRICVNLNRAAIGANSAFVLKTIYDNLNGQGSVLQNGSAALSLAEILSIAIAQKNIRIMNRLKADEFAAAERLRIKPNSDQPSAARGTQGSADLPSQAVAQNRGLAQLDPNVPVTGKAREVKDALDQRMKRIDSVNITGDRVAPQEFAAINRELGHDGKDMFLIVISENSTSSNGFGIMHWMAVHVKPDGSWISRHAGANSFYSSRAVPVPTNSLRHGIILRPKLSDDQIAQVAQSFYQQPKSRVSCAQDACQVTQAGGASPILVRNNISELLDGRMTIRNEKLDFDLYSLSNATHAQLATQIVRTDARAVGAVSFVGLVAAYYVEWLILE